jgi:hypothetical protein
MAQSFSQEKTAAINFIKRVYFSSPFEGVKTLQGDEETYHVVATSYVNVAIDSVLTMVEMAKLRAESIAAEGFAEPCVKFEMIEAVVTGNQITYLFLCTTLDAFITDVLKKNLVDGARFISAPGKKYIFTSISLENEKYTSSEMRDKVSLMKAKQLMNSLLNGSTLTSEQILRTDETDNRTEVTNTEIIRENARGFIQGLELLFSREITPQKTTYVYYAQL